MGMYFFPLAAHRKKAKRGKKAKRKKRSPYVAYFEDTPSSLTFAAVVVSSGSGKCVGLSVLFINHHFFFALLLGCRRRTTKSTREDLLQNSPYLQKLYNRIKEEGKRSGKLDESVLCSHSHSLFPETSTIDAAVFFFFFLSQNSIV